MRIHSHVVRDEANEQKRKHVHVLWACVFFFSLVILFFIFNASASHNMALRFTMWMYVFDCNAMRYWYFTIQPPLYVVCMCMYLLVLWWFPRFAISFSFIVVVVVSQMLSSHQVHFLYSFSLPPTISLSLSIAFMVPISMAQVKQ